MCSLSSNLFNASLLFEYLATPFLSSNSFNVTMSNILYCNPTLSAFLFFNLFIVSLYTSLISTSLAVISPSKTTLFNSNCFIPSIISLQPSINCPCLEYNSMLPSFIMAKHLEPSNFSVTYIIPLGKFFKSSLLPNIHLISTPPLEVGIKPSHILFNDVLLTPIFKFLVIIINQNSLKLLLFKYVFTLFLRLSFILLLAKSSNNSKPSSMSLSSELSFNNVSSNNSISFFSLILYFLYGL